MKKTGKIALAVIFGLAFLASAALAQYVEKAGTMTATIEGINLEKRIVTVKTPEGKMVDIKADEKVQNLSKLKVGDKVVLKYFASIAYQVAKPGEVQETAAKAEVKRAGAHARMITVTATVDYIDKNTNNVFLKGPGGNVVGVTAKDPKKLENIKVGDQVVITYTEALAISIEKAK